LYMSDIQKNCHKAMQFYDLVKKDNSETSDNEEEDVIDANEIMNELQQLSTHMHESVF